MKLDDMRVPILCPDGVIRIGSPKELVKVIETNLNKQNPKKWWQIWK